MFEDIIEKTFVWSIFYSKLWISEVYTFKIPRLEREFVSGFPNWTINRFWPVSISNPRTNTTIVTYLFRWYIQLAKLGTHIWLYRTICRSLNLNYFKFFKIFVDIKAGVYKAGKDLQKCSSIWGILQ